MHLGSFSLPNNRNAARKVDASSARVPPDPLSWRRINRLPPAKSRRRGSDSAVDDNRVEAKTVRISDAPHYVPFVRTGLALDGDLDPLARSVRAAGLINSTPRFHDQSQVINGASDLFVEVFGDAGRHTRMAVEVESVSEVK
jgi:hypothetical protein